MNKWIVGIAATLLAMLSGCGGGGEESSEPPAPPPGNRFAAVDAKADAAFRSQNFSGMGLSIYSGDGTLVFQKMYGSFAPSQRVALASASKLVSGVVLFRLIEQGYLSLDSTTGAVLGWTGENAAITLRQLLSFTSGMPAEHPCTSQGTITLAECVQQISTQALIAAPGTRFAYGSTHLQVAARMAEVLVGRSWNDLFASQLLAPLALPADMQYYTAPRQGAGTTNPLIAGGLRASMDEYAKILRLVFDKGMWQGAPLINPGLFEQQMIEPYPDAVIGHSPVEGTGLDFHYGLTAWLECTPSPNPCPKISSSGAFGFTPWIDRTHDYYAILGMELLTNGNGLVSFALQLEQDLQPLIVEALSP